MPIARCLIVSALLAACAGAPPARATATREPETPRLLVVIVVDQMRQDYLARMAPRWTHGLKRLLDEGAVFERNVHPYFQTVTCAGHATIGTGTFPATHGVILNTWWRGTHSAPCTEDAAVTSIGYEPGAEAVGHSAGQLLVPTLADRLRERSPASRVVTMSIKPRSAIMLAGRGGIVTWLDDRNVWATSTAYASAPDPAVQAFVSAHPRTALRHEVWSPLEDTAAYSGPDAAVGEAPPKGWTPTFPHPLAGAPGTPDQQFYTLWETSPYADEYLGAMAADLVQRLRLGRTDAVDYLGISFSALDYVGHAFGPESHEVQDTLLRLDRTMGRLLDTLDREVGAGRYVLGLSADHGVAPVPEARQSGGQAGGRISTQQLLRVANEALTATLGPGQHVVRAESTQIYLSDLARRRAEEHPEVLGAAIAALEHVPGVDRVLRGAGLERQRDAADPVVRAVALGHVPGRSGQLVVVPKPYYLVGHETATGTTHGTHHPYDQQVPLIFFGSGIKPGRYEEPSTPADLAPTLAARIGLPLPGVDGVARAIVFERP